MFKLRNFRFLRPNEARDQATNDEQVIMEEHVRLTMYNPQSVIRKQNLIGKHLEDLTQAVLELQQVVFSSQTKSTKATNTKAD